MYQRGALWVKAVPLASSSFLTSAPSYQSETERFINLLQSSKGVFPLQQHAWHDLYLID